MANLELIKEKKSSIKNILQIAGTPGFDSASNAEASPPSSTLKAF